MKQQIGIVFLMFCLQYSQAQVKSYGWIKDGNRGSINGATVHVLNTDVTVLSNDSGRIEFPVLPKGNYMIEISAIGFASI